jgi:hypothetical protein
MVGLVRILSVIYLNSSNDTIPQDLFEKFFVDALLHDDSLKKIEDCEGIYLTLMLYRILRYNLIFKKNVFNYAKKQAAARTI